MTGGPDGRNIAFIEFVEPGDDRGRVALVATDGRLRRLTREYMTMLHISWSPASQVLYRSAGTTIARAIHAWWTSRR